MKRFLVFLFLSFSCCIFAADELVRINYTDPANWAVYTAADKADKPFDVFYVYPTLVASKNVPLMQWDAKTKAKVIPFAEAQLSGFSKFANVYCPYVRQLEFHRCVAEIKSGFAQKSPENETMAVGAMDTVSALQYYLTHLNRGRPYILLGHSQGTYDLTIALTQCRDVNVQTGFVAAYLIGMPFFNQKFSPHPFAKGEDDIGVLISWNSQSKDAVGSPFTGKGAYCINPLNWRTDPTPAKAEVNPGSVFYDYVTKTFDRRTRCCGACVDPEKGALIVTDVPDSKYLADIGLGKGVWHTCDLWFFYEALVANARLRVAKWMEQHPSMDAVPAPEK